MKPLLFLIISFGFGCVQREGGAPSVDGFTCQNPEVSDDWIYPPPPYGTKIGDRFQDFTLKDCDGNQISFSNILGGSKLVLFNVSAGWCAPCANEAEILEKEIHQAFCNQGLGVVQVLFEDEKGYPAGADFCKRWTDKFDLRFPVLVDPDFTMKSYFEGNVSGQTPLNMLIDRDAMIRYKATGPIPSDFKQHISDLLSK